MSNCCGTKSEAIAGQVEEKSPCNCNYAQPSFAADFLETSVGKIWRVTNDWTAADWLGALAMRLDIGRMNYAVVPGVYASGNPNAAAPVLVTSNYKLTVDHLRRAIKGLDAWLLVLDTNGVNVWCAAGKGTFSACELVGKIADCRLKELVSHRTLIVPQLGATGVAAHDVFTTSGFKVVYGPVRATDLPAFMDAGMKATKDMRTVTFTLAERLAVVPVEVVHWAKWLLAVFVLCSMAAAVGSGDYGLHNFIRSGLCLISAFLGGVLLGPVLFYRLPGRAFAVKGVFSGILALAAMFLAGLLPLGNTPAILQASGWALLTLSISSFLMLAYTGSSPFTSLSGTLIETRIGFRVQKIAVVVGLLLLLSPLFLRKG